ncbi:GNAT family N-acetyltransferase [Streptomyces sp. FIT100]|uniref:GNAT family N-acetyltransferase n=1 Tax=Streptomyces sp. FIT100 TaxID=2837956 RepID=UPI0021C7159F|nr:GNAT family N-acetyltransferase [Streptomyces sp. FIT100]UUN27757.1 GNAT family N-acetyltransferase [Streptomyces sp. FIT100]
MEHLIRPVRADEWEKARELRLAALQDPAAPVAFLETYERGIARTPDFWRERTRDAAAGVVVRQFIAEAPDGRWEGTVTVLVERPEDEPRFGVAATLDQTHLVGVFVRPEARGRGLSDALFRAAIDWSWELAEPRIERVRLYVHEHNPRAQGFYRRIGFVPSGVTTPVPGDPDLRELELELRRPRSPFTD